MYIKVCIHFKELHQGLKWIGDFRNVFKLMDNSHASFNVISIAGLHFAYISCCYVG